MLTRESLKGLHTRQLLKALHRTRATQSHLGRIINEVLVSRELVPETALDDDHVIVSGWWLGSPHDDSDVTVAQLKDELATRPHVPNKQQSREIRKAKARANRDKGRRDRR